MRGNADTNVMAVVCACVEGGWRRRGILNELIANRLSVVDEIALGIVCEMVYLLMGTSGCFRVH